MKDKDLILKKLKIGFLNKHVLLAKKAFEDARKLNDKGEKLNTSEVIREFVNLARRELNYSPKTYFNDIFYALQSINRREHIL